MNNQFEHVYWKYILCLPIMLILAWWVRTKHWIYGLLGFGEPHINTIWFDGLGVRNALIRANAKCFRAMDVIYDYHLAMNNFFDRFWIGMRNAQAVRNRGRLVRQLLLREITQKKGMDDRVRILSLACGSARDVIDTMVEAKKSGIIVEALLVDINPEALTAAEVYAGMCGMSSSVETLQVDIMSVWPDAKKFAPHIVHIIGLLEYVPQDKAINLLAAVRGVLKGGMLGKGTLITSNTVDNLEAGFLKQVIGWSMIYRQAWQLSDLSAAAGFENVEIVGEPHKIHNVAIAK